MNFLSWIIFGLVVGIIVDIFDHRSSQGLLGTALLGILGALLGGFLGDLIFGVPTIGFNMSSFVVAAIGTLTILFIGRVIRHVS